MKMKRFIIAAFCLALAMTGCTPTSELYIGKPVTSAPVVKLQKDANSAGTWQTFDVTINYTYAVKEGILEIAGQGELSQHYQTVYNRVRRLRVYLFLLDGDSLVLETVDIPAFLTSTEDKFTFSKSFKDNESFRGLSFGYRGVATDMDGQAYFDSLP